MTGLTPDFDLGVFGDDYLYFMADVLTPEATGEAVDAIWRLLELEPGLEVLDLACGHGRIANSLAERGARVTGLDLTPRFLEVARADAAERGVEVEYVEGDMRSLPWSERFDRVVNWFTAFGYFDDAENRRVLEEVHRALRPGGRFLVEVNNRDRILREFRPAHVVERDRNFMLQLVRWDAETSRTLTEWVVIRDGEVRRYPFFVRMLTAPELRDWLRDAGFEDVSLSDWAGEPFTLESRRMVTVARKRRPDPTP
jgi:SAM-dependent methyltransferase